MGQECILLIAHGSRANLANEEVAALANQLAEETGTHVEVAFLDKIAQPNIPEMIDKIAASGTQKIIVLPYFLNTGMHVQRDIPEIVSASQKKYPQLAISIKEHFGSSGHVLELLKKILEE